MGITPTYDVSFDSNGGTEIETQSIISQGKVTEPTPPTKDGYTFAGWFTDDDTFLDEWTFASDTVSEAITLHAKWTINTYTITYNLDSGVNNESNPATYDVEDSLITLLDPTKTGYTFGGWFEEGTFETEVETIPAGSTGNVTLYAKWTENEYTITYNLDGGDNNVGNPAAFGITDLDITLLDATKDSYTFNGWYTEVTYENLVTSITTIGNVTLYAKFTVI